MWQNLFGHCAVLTKVSKEFAPHYLAEIRHDMRQTTTARVFEVDPNTVLQWLVEAAEQLQAFSRHVLHDVRVRQVQLDELFALLSAVKDGAVGEAEAIERLERSPQWVWAAMDPLWKAFHNGSYRMIIVMYRRTQPILTSSACEALLAFDN